MQNTGRNQFSYEVFKQAYDENPRIQNLVKNFDKDKIELKSSETDDIPTDSKKPSSDNTVSSMAKRATDLKDL
jgi:hypothetical protein|tara:strand:+ start:2401 stop:2619 length:219 start_codon:yes stop_codon:yes gene_type:complete